MEPVQWDERPLLRRPIMVAAFEGWNDAADAASTALTHIARSRRAQRFAAIDPEEFFDFTSTRPRVTLDAGLTRSIEWPANEFLAARTDTDTHELVLLRGTEPQLKWRTYCDAVIGVARALGVEMVVTLGALLADVAHTRPVRVTGTAADGELVKRLKLQRSHYEGPTGIVGVLGDALSRAGIPSASLWAAVPHYVAQTPSPKAALALVERAASLVGVPVDAQVLRDATAAYERQVNELVEADPDVAEYVSHLEHDVEDTDDELPSGDSLAADIERFLRDQGTTS